MLVRHVTEAEPVRVLVDEWRHMFSLVGLGGFRICHCQRARTDHLGVEPSGVRAGKRVRHVVAAPSFVPLEHQPRHVRIEERAVRSDANHRVGRKPDCGLDVPRQHVSFRAPRHFDIEFRAKPRNGIILGVQGSRHDDLQTRAHLSHALDHELEQRSIQHPHHDLPWEAGGGHARLDDRGRATRHRTETQRSSILLGLLTLEESVAAMHIGSRAVGAGAPVLIVAELSANHKQDLGRAVTLVRAAHEAGADAIKIQTYRPDTITIDVDAPPFRIAAGTTWDGRTLFSLYAEAQTPWEWHEPLAKEAASLGMEFFSSPFDPSAVEFLESMQVPALKIASPEIVDVGLIRLAAQTGKPLVISTGMATLDEIAEAVRTARDYGARDIVLLKCTSSYPAPPEEANLRTIPNMTETFGCPVGLSDHTLGIAVPVAAVALGACMIEKHFTLSRADGGPDSGFSLEPDEFRGMVDAVRVAEQSLGRVNYEPTEHERASRTLRRSLFVVEDMRAGDILTDANVRSIRPGHGLHTRHLPQVLGRRIRRPAIRGTPLSWDLLD